VLGNCCSELKVNRKLKLTCDAGPVWRIERWNWSSAGAEERIYRGHIRIVEQVERFGHEIEFAVLADFEIPKQAEIEFDLSRGAERIAREVQRSR